MVVLNGSIVVTVWHVLLLGTLGASLGNDTHGRNRARPTGQSADPGTYNPSGCGRVSPADLRIFVPGFRVESSS